MKIKRRQNGKHMTPPFCVRHQLGKQTNPKSKDEKSNLPV